MDEYDLIFKRKSFHLFRGVGSDRISQNELRDIEEAYLHFDSLYPEIATAVRIVPADRVNFKRDAEYCILIYSEKKENYLMNVGYIGEQLDLYLVGHNIGSLWYGIGKPDEEEYNGLSFVIMIAVHKVNDPSLFRKDMFKAKRKGISEIWSGEDPGIANVVRFAPSACNTQPWYVRSKNGELTVFRYRKPGKRGIMPAASVAYYNRIDIGIFLRFLEICMKKSGMEFTRELFPDRGGDGEMTKAASYKLCPKGEGTSGEDILRTKRLRLYLASDAQMERLIADQTIPELREAYREMLDGCRAHPGQREWYGVWNMELNDGSGHVVGNLSFKGLTEDGTVEIGYGTEEEYEGQGYMTEAVAALVPWAAGREGVKRIEAETEEDNTASKRVLEKTGFVPTGERGEEGPRFVWKP